MRDHADVLKDRTVLDAHFLQPRVGQLKRDIYRHVLFFFSLLRMGVPIRNGKTKTTLLFCLLVGKQKRYDKKVTAPSFLCSQTRRRKTLFICFAIAYGHAHTQ